MVMRHFLQHMLDEFALEQLSRLGP